MAKKKLALVACVLMLLGCGQLLSAAEIGEILTSQEVKTLLTHKTFFVKQFHSELGGQEKIKDFHAYFGPSGSMQINYSAKHIKTGRWGVADDGEFCLQFAVPAGSQHRVAERCGILVKRGPYSFDRVSTDGTHTATLTLVANGNKFPGK